MIRTETVEITNRRCPGNLDHAARPIRESRGDRRILERAYGLANVEMPSLVTTISFMLAGIATTHVVYRLLFPLAGL